MKQINLEKIQKGIEQIYSLDEYARDGEPHVALSIGLTKSRDGKERAHFDLYTKSLGCQDFGSEEELIKYIDELVHNPGGYIECEIARKQKEQVEAQKIVDDLAKSLKELEALNDRR